MSRHTRYAEITAFETRDGSTIRELMHPDHHAVQGQSLAEALVAPGTSTHLHRHHRSEELYHITAGEGVMTLGTSQFNVTTGDTVCIPPGTPHCIHNPGPQPLRILCACTPPYAHADTELLDAAP